jgi:transcriptional regulator with XRE-family HTH domain
VSEVDPAVADADAAPVYRDDEWEYLRGLGRRLRVLRVGAGLSQRELAVRAGTDRGYIGRLERGVQGVGIVRLRRIAEALATTVRTLIPPQPPDLPDDTARGGGAGGWRPTSALDLASSPTSRPATPTAGPVHRRQSTTAHRHQPGGLPRQRGNPDARRPPEPDTRPRPQDRAG